MVAPPPRARGVLPEGMATDRRHLIGAYFTHEYSIEAAALGNPSMVVAPDQRGLDDAARCGS